MKNNKLGSYIFLILLTPCIGIFAEASDGASQANEINQLLEESGLLNETMTAQEYNLAGMYFYEQQRWYEAEIMFLGATEIDSRHVLAHYNLACVLSLQFNNGEAKHPDRLGDNESAPFYYLYRAVLLDSARMERARGDSDLHNIRNFDPDLFDAITLLEDQRERFENQVTFKSANSFEGDTQLIFEDESGEEIWFSSEEKAFDDYPFFSLSHDSFIPEAVTNEDMVGKKFRILSFLVPYEPEMAGGDILSKKVKLISLESLGDG
ncbi:MAG: hypothetical protein PQJ59_17855 [Spirochaetales bacterium]|nr:hypothetical protein [Spirochaetales bacterium]